MVMFAFWGLEMLGITAGEAEDPHKSMPKAINRTGLRLGVFYIGSLMVIMCLIPWSELDPHASPFVLFFLKVGIPAAGTVMNFVLLTAAFSAGNSAIFSTGRMLFSLSRDGHAPKFLQKVNRHQVPSLALAVTVALTLLSVVVNFLVPKQAFAYVTSVATLGAIWTWAIILIAHMKYRKAVRLGHVPESSFKMPGAPWTTVLSLLFLAFVTVLLAFDSSTRVALYVAPVWALIMIVGYTMTRRRFSPATTEIVSLEAALHGPLAPDPTPATSRVADSV
jgi:AAT family amino acid transporter/D-serine/D-alanine/glycine transporter